MNDLSPTSGLSAETAGEMTVAALRLELGMSLEEFAAAIGLGSKSGALRAERGELISVDTALAIEALSLRDGVARIDAARLNEDVRKARHGIEADSAEADNRG